MMPRYLWLLTQKIDTNALPVPPLGAAQDRRALSRGFENGPAQAELAAQASRVVENLKQGMITNAPPDREIIALIAYLQRLGTDIKVAPPAPAVAPKTAQLNSTTEARN
jgi:cytochrome c oxidase cbb3-type subunit I/II